MLGLHKLHLRFEAFEMRDVFNDLTITGVAGVVAALGVEASLRLFGNSQLRFEFIYVDRGRETHVTSWTCKQGSKKYGRELDTYLTPFITSTYRAYPLVKSLAPIEQGAEFIHVLKVGRQFDDLAVSG